MKVVIAADSFKGSMSASEVSKNIEIGYKKIFKNAEIVRIPMADGGEGTVETLVEATDGRYVYLNSTDPLGRKIQTCFGVIYEEIAVIEMASASGLTLLSEDEFNPLITTTYGTGEILRAALENGFKKIYVGLGGSATNDGGVGMAQALGYSFKDIDGKEIGFGGGELHKIQSIDTHNKHPLLDSAEITVISDVTNKLCGPDGASYVYGPQKGATREMVLELDDKLSHLSSKINEILRNDVNSISGAGAAGGLGAGMIAFCNANVKPGVEVLLDLLDFENDIMDADLVITGEGKIDNQSKYGKVPVGVARKAKKFNKPVVAVVGSRGDDVCEVYDLGIDFIQDIITKPMTLSEAMNNAEMLLINAGEDVGRLMKLRGFSDENSSS
ncbi:glycerate kinase [Gudongella sp. DL1XJH-153]|uniref:glycerate kinase n=1 Tax=Gudongella sp. DL1XJH-153 TaxID=3409804 RepID=UPI003BB5CC7E